MAISIFNHQVTVNVIMQTKFKHKHYKQLANKKTNKYMYVYKLTDRQTDKQTDRQTDRQIFDRQTDRQIYRAGFCRVLVW